jgi:hypothetical protein
VHVPLGEVPPYRLVPRGGTALLDAVGFAFAGEGEWLASLPEHERPGTVIAVIATDGMENSSREYNRTQIQEIIKRQQEAYNWQILFIGANMNAVQVASSYGISAQHAMTFRASPAGAAASLQFGAPGHVTGAPWRGATASPPRSVSPRWRCETVEDDRGRRGVRSGTTA